MTAVVTTTTTATAKVFKNGRSQAVRLPAAFRFDTKEVYVRRDEATGDVILSKRPAVPGNWDEFFKLVEAAKHESADFMIDRDDRPAEERDLF